MSCVQLLGTITNVPNLVVNCLNPLLFQRKQIENDFGRKRRRIMSVFDTKHKRKSAAITAVAAPTLLLIILASGWSWRGAAAA